MTSPLQVKPLIACQFRLTKMTPRCFCCQFVSLLLVLATFFFFYNLYSFLPKGQIKSKKYLGAEYNAQKFALRRHFHTAHCYATLVFELSRVVRTKHAHLGKSHRCLNRILSVAHCCSQTSTSLKPRMNSCVKLLCCSPLFVHSVHCLHPQLWCSKLCAV